MPEPINEFIRLLNTAGEAFWHHALGMSLQVSVLIVVLALLDWLLLRRLRASIRYAAWSLVLVKLMLPVSLSSPVSLARLVPSNPLSPAETAASPARVHAPLAHGSGDRANAPADEGSTPTAPAAAVGAAAGEPVEPSTAKESVTIRPLHWKAGLFLVWLGAVAALFTMVVRRTLRVRRIVDRSVAPPAALERLLTDCMQAARLRRSNVAIRISPELGSPAICGFWRATILVPQPLAFAVDASQMRFVLAHELTHWKRFDLQVNCLQSVLQILYFFHPLVWLANIILRRLREHAVDEAVLGTLRTSADEYITTLLDVASHPRRTAELALRLVGVVESHKALDGRVKRMLTRRLPQTARLGARGLIAVSVMGCILLPMAETEMTASDDPVDDRASIGTEPDNYKPPETAMSRDTDNWLDYGRDFEDEDFFQGVIINDSLDRVIMGTAWRIHTILHPAHVQMVGSVAFAPDGKTIATAGADKTVRLWDVASSELLETIERPVNCTDVAFSPDGSLLAIAGGDHGRDPPGELVLWDLAAGEIAAVLESHETAKYVTSAAFSPDGVWLASGGTDAVVKLWHVGTGTLQRKWQGHTGLISDVAFSADGELLASASFDTTIRLWNVWSGEEMGVLAGHDVEVREVAFSPQSNLLVSASEDKTARVWDTASKEQVGVMKGHPGRVFSAAFSPDGRYVATGGDKRVMLWEAATQSWADPDTFPKSSSTVVSLAISPDGKTLAFISGWNTVQIWTR